jgi:P-type E1-E2 ATPase
MSVINTLFLVIALAWGRDLQSLCYAGIIGIFDPPRVGAAEAIEVVQTAGVHVKMITGDSLETACSVGKFAQV